MTNKVKIFRVFLQQLKKSRITLVLLLALTISLIGNLIIETWYFPYLLFGSGYFLAFIATMAMTTAVHEGEHVSKLHELGFTAENFVAHRVGDVSFRIKDVEKLTPEECYQVAIAPYVRIGQYIVEIPFLVLLTIINWYSRFPLNILLFLFTVLGCLHLMANLCAYFVIKTQMSSGFLISFSRALTSRGDIDDIIAWNKKS